MKFETTVTLEIKITTKCDKIGLPTAFHNAKDYIDHALKGAGKRIMQDDSMDHRMEHVFGRDMSSIGHFSMKTIKVED